AGVYERRIVSDDDAEEETSDEAAIEIAENDEPSSVVSRKGLDVGPVDAGPLVERDVGTGPVFERDVPTPETTGEIDERNDEVEALLIAETGSREEKRWTDFLACQAVEGSAATDAWISFNVFPWMSFHSVRPFAARPSKTPAAADGDSKT